MFNNYNIFNGKKQMAWQEIYFWPSSWLDAIRVGKAYGTAIRLKEMTAILDDDHLRMRHKSNWSILEHLGHFSDLEELHDGRIDDFKAGLPVLQAADMNN